MYKLLIKVLLVVAVCGMLLEATEGCCKSKGSCCHGGGYGLYGCGSCCGHGGYGYGGCGCCGGYGGYGGYGGGYGGGCCCCYPCCCY